MREPKSSTSSTGLRSSLGEGFDRSARWIGDFENPMLDEERNRYVWFEGATIGLRFALLGMPLVLAWVVLTGGIDAVKTALPFVWLIVGAMMIQGYWVQRHRADTLAFHRIDLRPRTLVDAAAATTCVGAVLWVLSDRFSSGQLTSLIAPIGFAGAMFIFVTKLKRDRVEARDLAPEEE